MRLKIGVVLAVLLVAIAFSFTHPSLASEHQRPNKLNVLFIAIDDLRPELGCYGADHIHSPNIDRLASRSLLFKKAYCQQAVCNPSRTSLLTGRRPDSIRVTGNHSHFRKNFPDAVTLPEHFKNHGYHAQAIGKIYHGVFPEGASKTKWDTMGDPQSWSVPATRFGPRYYFTESGIAAAKEVYRKIYKPQNPKPGDWTTKLVFGPATESPDVPDNLLYDGKVADAAVKALGELKGSEDPFFLAVGFIKPHSPYIAPKKYFDLYEDVPVAIDQRLPNGAPSLAGHGSGELRRYTDQPAEGPISQLSQRRVRQAYFACISFVDAQIGRLLDELDRLDLADNTIICLCSDHGYHLGEHGLWGKTTNFELDTRVPLMVRSPGMQAAGEATNSLAELVDIYPTLAELAGLPLHDELEGRSFAALLDDPTKTTKTIALSQYPRSGNLMGYSMRTQTHRLTQWVNQQSGHIRAVELYQYTSNDQVESQNLYRRCDPRQLRRLRKRFNEAFAPSFVKTGDPISPKDDNATSFEGHAAGPFASLNTNVGTWSNVVGSVQIDDQHANSGNQCLQIAGGDASSIELTIDDGLKTDGHLCFWAERWTKREPFRFRIEKLSGAGWSQIYDGDNNIRVGRAFLSHVQIPLADDDITKLRFSVTSPPNTGLLIDDLRISPAEPMKVTGIEVVPFTLPALKGSQQSALVKLKVTTRGTLNPIPITDITASLVGETSSTNIKSYQPFYRGNDPNFHWNQPFGVAWTPEQGTSHQFAGRQELNHGENYVWLACQLSAEANIDQTIAGRIDEITFSNGESKSILTKPPVQRLGVAVRKGGDDGIHTYRIPGLATTNAGTLIGVYDVRHDGSRDLPGNIDVGMSRSTDGGRTWEPMKVIMDMGNAPEWKGDGIGDPAVLVDRQTGTVWVSATWSHGNRSWFGSGPGLEPEQTGQWILVKSDDDGKTWSDPINITRQVKRPEWSFLLQGPGKGITMSDGTIVFPAQYQDPPNKNDKRANRLPHSTLVYSLDHGKSWKVATGAWDDTTESQIVELADGQLMLNCRNNQAPRRVVMTSQDMGQTWQPHSTHVKDLIEPGSCMASLINVGRELGWRKIQIERQTEFLLFSNPDSLNGRNHMTIKASLDSGVTWPAQQHLLLDEQGSRGYSCMSMIDSETVGILYEGSQADLTFQRIKVRDILNPPRDQKTKNPAFAKKKSSNDVPESSSADRLTVARVFGDHMILQVNQPIRIWGTAQPHSEVVVQFMSQTGTAKSDHDGNWLAQLRPVSEYIRTGQSLEVTSGTDRVVLQNVLVGEVWYCAGQSNMEWPVSRSSAAATEMRSADDPELRLLNFSGAARGSSGPYDAAHFAALVPNHFSRGSWAIATPDSVSDFSAVAYYFARKLRAELGCPVGMINVAIGGTPIESWIASDELAKHPTLNAMLNGNWLENSALDKWCRQRARSNLQAGLTGDFEIPGDEFGPNHSFKPGFMHAASVAPFQPMSIRGVLWYQGESNAENIQRITQYQSAFPLLVNSWRTGFQNARLPIGFVQLPGMNRPNWPLFRDQQRRSLDQITNVGMAITIDIGDKQDVHPRAKQPVGERLAAWALGSVYEKDIVPMGPLTIGQPRIVDAAAIVSFKYVGQGLKTTDGNPPRHFEVAGDDQHFFPAVAQIIDRHQIKLSSPEVDNPVFVRYAWSPYPEPPVNLTNSAGMPVSPFITRQPPDSQPHTIPFHFSPLTTSVILIR